MPFVILASYFWRVVTDPPARSSSKILSSTVHKRLLDIEIKIDADIGI